jgi:hypothetical protein
MQRCAKYRFLHGSLDSCTKIAPPPPGGGVWKKPTHTTVEIDLTHSFPAV